MDSFAAGPAADPAAAMKQIQEQIQEKFDESGMGNIEELLKPLNQVMAKAKEGPGEAMDAMVGKAEELKSTLENGLKNPETLAPDSFKWCAAWYGGQVKSQLESFGTEASEIADSVKKAGSDVSEPLKSLASGLEEAVGKLEGAVKGLADLPKMLQEELQGKESPEDIAKIDTGRFRKALEVGDVNGPLNSIMGMQDMIKSAITALSDVPGVLEGFVQDGPAKVKGAFVPPPFCIAEEAILAQAPKVMSDLLGLLEKLKGISLKPLQSSLESAMDTIGKLDVESIKEPVSKFMESATGLVDKLETTVKGAKAAGGVAALASAGPPEMPAMPGAAGGKKKPGCVVM